DPQRQQNFELRGCERGSLLERALDGTGHGAEYIRLHDYRQEDSCIRHHASVSRRVCSTAILGVQPSSVRMRVASPWTIGVSFGRSRALSTSTRTGTPLRWISSSSRSPIRHALPEQTLYGRPAGA